MVNIKENLWLVALVAGILGIITIFVPAWAVFDSEVNFWFWSMYIYNGEIDFIPTDEPLFTLGLVTTFIIIIGTAILLFMGLFAKLREKRFDILGIIGGVLLIIAPIVFFAGTEAEYTGYFEYYNVNVGLILPFIAGALGIFSGVMGIMEKRG